MIADIEPLVAEFGEKWRRLITSAVAWLDGAEPTWGLSEPMDRREFVEDLLTRARLPTETNA